MSRLPHLNSIGFSVLVLSAIAASGVAASRPAAARDVAQCQAVTKKAVILCCTQVIRVKKPLWMMESRSNCSELVKCDSRVRGAKHCHIEVPPTGTGSSTPPPPPTTKPAGTAVSDMRAKTNLHLIGTTVLDLPLYSFEYKNRPGTFIGVMAQDVLKVKPSAVILGSDGFYRVNYEALGIEMYQVK